MPSFKVRNVVVVPEKEVTCTVENTGFRFNPVIHKTCLFTAFTMSGVCLLAAGCSAGTHCDDMVFQFDVQATVRRNKFIKFDVQTTVHRDKFIK